MINERTKKPRMSSRKPDAVKPPPVPGRYLVRGVSSGTIDRVAARLTEELNYLITKNYDVASVVELRNGGLLVTGLLRPIAVPPSPFSPMGEPETEPSDASSQSTQAPTTGSPLLDALIRSGAIHPFPAGSGSDAVYVHPMTQRVARLIIEMLPEPPTHPLPASTEEKVRRLLEQHLRSTQASVLHRVREDFVRLSEAHEAYHKQIGPTPGSTCGVPELFQLIAKVVAGLAVTNQN